MLIRSQDLKRIMNIDTIDVIEVYFGEISTTVNGKEYILGNYSTSEKAIKVLDMIQASYAQLNNPYNTRAGFDENPVFQMPTEEELDEPTSEDIINDVLNM